MGRILALLAGLFMVIAPWATGRDWRDMVLGAIISIPFWLMVFVRQSKREIAAELALLPSIRPEPPFARIYREGADGEIYHEDLKDSSAL